MQLCSYSFRESERRSFDAKHAKYRSVDDRCLLVGAYLSTWSAALIHSLVFPALGAGRNVHSITDTLEGQTQVSFAQRRHTPLTKSISVVAPPPSTAEYHGLIHRIVAQLPFAQYLPPQPSLSPHAGRLLQPAEDVP